MLATRKEVCLYILKIYPITILQNDGFAVVSTEKLFFAVVSTEKLFFAVVSTEKIILGCGLHRASLWSAQKKQIFAVDK